MKEKELDMKENVIKLYCPRCDKKFETNIPNKVWCSRDCGKKFSEYVSDVNSKIELNHSRQKRIRSKAFRYDLENDKFYLIN